MGVAAQFPALHGWPANQPLTPLSTRTRRFSRLSSHLLGAWLRSLGAPAFAQREERERALERWAKATLDSLNVRVHLRGSFAGGPTLIVANHVSWLDICVLSSVRGARFVAKSEVRAYPLIGSTARRFGSLFHIRGHFRDAARIKEQLADALRAGDHAVVFPEGTTSSGRVVRTFYPAMIQAAIDARAAVQPVSIRYTDADGWPTPAPNFIDDMTLLDSIRNVLRAPEIVAQVTLGEPLSPIGRSRRELAQMARTLIARSLNVPLADDGPSGLMEFAQSRTAAKATPGHGFHGPQPASLGPKPSVA